MFSVQCERTSSSMATPKGTLLVSEVVPLLWIGSGACHCFRLKFDAECTKLKMKILDICLSSRCITSSLSSSPLSLDSPLNSAIACARALFGSAVARCLPRLRDHTGWSYTYHQWEAAFCHQVKQLRLASELLSSISSTASCSSCATRCSFF